jgi:putative SOS response-associated peptidase YedK
MCGRYTLATDGRTLAGEFDIGGPVEWRARYNITPSQTALTVTTDDGGRRQASAMRWGLVPFWAKDIKQGYRLINARAETVAEKPAFRAAYRKRRCLVLADGYYEWARRGERKQPYHIHRQSAAPFAFAGLWERWQPDESATPLISYSIITCSANERLREIHDRMPVVLAKSQYAAWLDPNASLSNLAALLAPATDHAFVAVPVSTYVNSPRHDDQRCILRLDDPTMI